MKFRGYRVFPHGELDDLVARDLAPALGDAAFFFLRWSTPRPHLRVRIASDVASSVQARGAFVVERACYRPDLRRVGGRRAIASAHALEVASSRLVCALLAEPVAKPVAALVVGAVLLGELAEPEERWALLDDFAVGMASMLAVDGATLDRFRLAVEATVDGAVNRRGELLARILAFDDRLFDGALVPLREAARAAASTLRDLSTVRRRRIAMRHLHGSHNRLGLGGVAELDAVLRLRRAVEVVS